MLSREKKESTPSTFEDIKKQADSGDPNAQIRLAIMYFHGKEYPQEIERGKTLLQHLDEQGNADAQYLLANIARPRAYRFPYLNTEWNIGEYIRLLNKAADQGHVHALYELASEVKPINSVSILEKIVTQDTSHSIIRTLHYFTNDLPPECLAAADLAKILSAELKENKILTSSKEDKLIDYLEQAAKKGYVKAFVLLGHVYSKHAEYHFLTIPQNIPLAIQYYQKAEDQAGAAKQLGIFYEKGIGVEQDFGTAARYYYQASKYYYTENQKFLIALYTQTNAVYPEVVFYTYLLLHDLFTTGYFNETLTEPFITQLNMDFKKLSLDNPGKFYELLESEFSKASLREKKIISKFMSPDSYSALEKQIQTITVELSRYHLPTSISELIVSTQLGLFYHPKTKIIPAPEEAKNTPTLSFLCAPRFAKKHPVENKKNKCPLM